MPLVDILTALWPRDLAALALHLLCFAGIAWLIEHPPKGRPSVTTLMADYRRDWMRMMAAREVRIFDSQILASLRQGTSFFASTVLLSIGGVLALAGNPAPLTGLAAGLTQDRDPEVLWQLKLLVVAVLLALAFLRFVWANRVFGYCAVVMASVPNDVADPDCKPRAMRAAELNIRAAVNFNRGLQAVYYAIAAAAWLVGPAALVAATVVTTWIVWSREFASIPRQVILR